MTAPSRTALVTGGAGFIGSHLVEALTRLGDRVVVVDTARGWEIGRGAEFPAERAARVTLDLRTADTRDILRAWAPDVIFHLAGIASVGEKWESGTMISTATARLNPEQSKELSRKIMALIDDAVDKYRTQTGEDVRPVTIRADLFPLPDLGGRS